MHNSVRTNASGQYEAEKSGDRKPTNPQVGSRKLTAYAMHESL